MRALVVEYEYIWWSVVVYLCAVSCFSVIILIAFAIERWQQDSGT